MQFPTVQLSSRSASTLPYKRPCLRLPALLDWVQVSNLLMRRVRGARRESCKDAEGQALASECTWLVGTCGNPALVRKHQLQVQWCQRCRMPLRW
mmetsp:Transcript_84488/g.196436  ORF Transcript_84488/g.196436 Transcript_84488/m.196436 type:complete len:95 (-) Transcript_84488:516-800(-)